MVKEKNKKLFGFLLLCEVFLTSCFLVLGFLCERQALWKEEDFSLYDAGSFQMSDHSMAVSSGEVSSLKSPPYSLSKGSYTLGIYYQADMDQSVSFRSSDNFLLDANTFHLSRNYNYTEYSFTAKTALEDFTISIDYNGNGTFEVNRILLKENGQFYFRYAAVLLCLSVLLDIMYVKRKSLVLNRNVYLGLAALWFMASIPLFQKGSIVGHDFPYHILRIEGLADGLKRGVFPVYMESLFFDGNGYPSSVYYNDLLLLFPALLRVIGFPVYSAFNAYVLMINLLTVLISWFGFHKIFRNQHAALAAVFVYVTASYRLVNLYIRAAVGEYSAMAFLPLIALAMWELYAEYDTCTVPKTALYLALGMSGLLCTHLLSTVLVASILLIVGLCFWRKSFSLKGLMVYALAATESLFLTVFYLLPFVDYYFNVEAVINGVMGRVKNIQYLGATLFDLFAFVHDPLVAEAEGVNKMLSLSPGLLILSVIMIGIIMIMNCRSTKKEKYLTLMCILTLFMSTQYFPWDVLANYTKTGYLLSSVQFPWRYVGITAVFAALLAGCMTENYMDSDTELLKNRKWYTAILLCALHAYTCFMMYGNILDNGYVKNLIDTAELNTYFVGNGEYVRLYTLTENLGSDFYSEGIEKLTVSEREGTTIQLYCSAGNEGGYIEVPLMKYKGYHAVDQSGNELEITDGSNNVVAFRVPPKYEGDITVSYQPPFYWYTAAWISFLSAICLTAAYILSDRKKLKHSREEGIAEV